MANKTMNELFHVMSSIGITAGLTDTDRNDDSATAQTRLPVIASVFFLGIVSHALMDYLPHTYPMESNVDIIASIILTAVFIISSVRPYRAVVISSLAGCTVPDVIDLGPKMANACCGLGLPVYDPIFPWHWRSYSGSLYNEGHAISAINHAMMFFSLLIVLRMRSRHLKNIFSRHQQALTSLRRRWFHHSGKGK